MDRLPRDVLFKIGMESDLNSIAKLCKTNPRFNETICQNRYFWMNKLYQMYPELTNLLPSNTDYRYLLKTLVKGEKYWYDAFVSYNNPDNAPPKMWPFNKKRLSQNRSVLQESDYEIAETVYPDFRERSGEETAFYVIGDYPKGIPVWLIKTSYVEIDFPAHPNKQYAVDGLISVLNKWFHEDIDITEQEFEQQFQEFYKTSLPEFLANGRQQLLQNGYWTYRDLDMNSEIWITLHRYILGEDFSKYHNVRDESYDINRIDQLPKALLIEMSLEYDLDTLLNLCQSSTRYNQAICDNQAFWKLRFARDYPDAFQRLIADYQITDWKDLYARRHGIYSYISKGKSEQVAQLYYRNDFLPGIDFTMYRGVEGSLYLKPKIYQPVQMIQITLGDRPEIRLIPWNPTVLGEEVVLTNQYRREWYTDDYQYVIRDSGRSIVIEKISK